jgi:8-oxo-dGTP pyrophosphatase MutT (NUDIX family)
MPSASDFLSLLKAALALKLPGEAAQNRLSRLRSYSTAEYLLRNPSHRESAVLIVIWPEADTWRCLLIQRPEYDGPHGGQMGLPGGRREETDRDLMQTAIRETLEETGVEVPEEAVAGALSSLYIPVSNFLVQPYVALIRQRPVFHPDPSEVSALLDFDLKLLLKPETLKSKERMLAKGLQARTPYFDIEGSEVWGATAMMLSELAAVLETISF